MNFLLSFFIGFVERKGKKKVLCVRWERNEERKKQKQNSPNAPTPGLVAKITSLNSSPFNSLNFSYRPATLAMNSSTLLSGTKDTVHPPHPAPVNLDPYAPDSSAIWVRVSSSGQEHSKSWEQEVWEEDMSAPRALNEVSAEVEDVEAEVEARQSSRN